MKIRLQGAIQDEAVLKSFLDGNGIFVCLPTGSGKSLCYCLLPTLLDTLRGTVSSVVVVASPLTALMTNEGSSENNEGRRG